jgi:hypothetical protein
MVIRAKSAHYQARPIRQQDALVRCFGAEFGGSSSFAGYLRLSSDLGSGPDSSAGTYAPNYEERPVRKIRPAWRISIGLALWAVGCWLLYRTLLYRAGAWERRSVLAAACICFGLLLLINPLRL